MASRTASETRFSEGMSSRPVAWRLASSRGSSAICGSTAPSGRFMRSLAPVVMAESLAEGRKNRLATETQSSQRKKEIDVEIVDSWGDELQIGPSEWGLGEKNNWGTRPVFLQRVRKQLKRAETSCAHVQKSEERER